VNVSRPAKPNYPALKALEESALLSLFRQVLWRKGFETIHAEIIRRLCGSEIGGHAPKLDMGLLPPTRQLPLGRVPPVSSAAADETGEGKTLKIRTFG
jgi:hypothetical protein